MMTAETGPLANKCVPNLFFPQVEIDREKKLLQTLQLKLKK